MNFIYIPYFNGHIFFLSTSREDFPFLKVYGRLNFLFPFESSQNEWIKSFLKHSFSKPSWKSWGFPGGSDGKESTCNAGDTGDLGLIPESGRSPGGGNGSPFQYSCLGNLIDRGDWWATVHGITVRENWSRKRKSNINILGVNNLQL